MSIQWAPITAHASPRWCWTVHAADASPMRARASVTPPPSPSRPAQSITLCPWYCPRIPAPVLAQPYAPSPCLRKALFSVFMSPGGQLAWWLKVKVLQGACHLLTLCTHADLVYTCSLLITSWTPTSLLHIGWIGSSPTLQGDLKGLLFLRTEEDLVLLSPKGVFPIISLCSFDSFHFHGFQSLSFSLILLTLSGFMFVSRSVSLSLSASLLSCFSLNL